ncbi:MAG: sigma-70 family RNA polymerase sigma factor [Actinomycetota bacterium]|nr:sigma-70 family RNA polymerase sigma factor [Actinomycetota bacterium]
MSSESTNPSPLPSEFDTEWEALIKRGTAQGSLTIDDVVRRLQNVELSEDLIQAISDGFAERGIYLDEGEPLEHEDESTGSRPRKTLLKNRKFLRKPSTSVADSTTLYLQEIGQVDLLSAQEEVRLAEKIQNGLHASKELARLRHASNTSGSEPEGKQIQDLMRKVRQGEKAKKHLIEANLRLVVSIAKRKSGFGMDISDLIQEGSFGLMRAVEKFDHTKGVKFSTYATWWIRQSVSRCIADQSQNIRVPVHMRETMNKVRVTRIELFQNLGREPLPEEIAENCHIDVNKVKEILRLDTKTVSLDMPVGNEDANFGDFIKDKDGKSPEQEATTAMLAEDMDALLDELDEREKKILQMRFGLAGERALTLEEVGQRVGLTRERVRQIESKATYKLKRSGQRDNLRVYLEDQ